MEHLSPTSIKIYQRNKDAFYIYYILKKRKLSKQTQPMAVGAAFDAYIKAYLAKQIGIKDMELETLFKEQVEKQNWEWAAIHGKYVFNEYKKTKLVPLIDKLNQTVRMEWQISKEIEGVPLLGKPDLYFVNRRRMLFDWKINGYCAKRTTSPCKGHLEHKKAELEERDGLVYNKTGMEEINKDWAQQLIIYAWVLGEPIGTDALIGVEQGVGAYNGSPFPDLRFFSFINPVGAEWQRAFMDEIKEIWEVVNSDYFFRDLSFTESKEREKALEDDDFVACLLH